MPAFDPWAESKAEEIRLRREQKAEKTRADNEALNLVHQKAPVLWEALKGLLKAKIVALNEHLKGDDLRFDGVGSLFIIRTKCGETEVRFDPSKHTVGIKDTHQGDIEAVNIHQWDIEAVNGSVMLTLPGQGEVSGKKIAESILDHVTANF